MSEYVKCPLCGIETKANEAHGCAGPRVEVIDPRDARIAALEAELAESEAACAGYRAALEKAELAMRVSEGLFKQWTELFTSYVKDGIDANEAVERIMPHTRARCDEFNAHQRAVVAVLQSNPGKAVGDVIAAARMTEAKRQIMKQCQDDRSQFYDVNVRIRAEAEYVEALNAQAAALAKLEGRE